MDKKIYIMLKEIPKILCLIKLFITFSLGIECFQIYNRIYVAINFFLWLLKNSKPFKATTGK